MSNLSDTARQTLASIARAEEATRRTIADDTGLSLPTVTGALAELALQDLVSEVRRDQGARGRATLVFGIMPRAGWTLGVDIGSSQISFLARDLKGSMLAEMIRSHSLPPHEAGTLAGDLVSDWMRTSGDHGPLRATAVALNQVVPRQLSTKGAASTAATMLDRFRSAAGISPDTEILAENNVNCAAVAEFIDGELRGCEDAAYLQIGIGIGLGLFCDGALIRGGHGAAGELAQLPLSWDRTTPCAPDAIEKEFGANGLMRTVRKRWTGNKTVPESPESLFRAAARGHELSRKITADHAGAIGRIAAAVTAIVDPAVLVIGGGLARNDYFLSLIREELHASNTQVDVRQSSSGPNASVKGAAILARDLALNHLLLNYHRPVLNRPTLY